MTEVLDLVAQSAKEISKNNRGLTNPIVQSPLWTKLIHDLLSSTIHDVLGLFRQISSALLITNGFQRKSTGRNEGSASGRSSELEIPLTQFSETDRSEPVTMELLGKVELRAGEWIMKALTYQSHYRHAAEFLLQKKLQSAMELAKFVCKKEEVEGLPTKLQYVRNVKRLTLISNDDNCQCCTCSRCKCLPLCDDSEVGEKTGCGCFQSICRCWNGSTESVEDPSGTDVQVFPKFPVLYSRFKYRYWCSLDCVATWKAVPGLIIYSALIALVVISVIIGLKTRDKRWDASEVSVNLILTGAVAIVIGVLSFDINGRKIAFDWLQFREALSHLPSDPKKRQAVVRALKNQKRPYLYVSDTNSSWLPEKAVGWTQILDPIPVSEVSDDGKLLVGRNGVSAVIFKSEREIEIEPSGDEDVLQAKAGSFHTLDTNDSTRAVVEVLNCIK